jgi:hypothetical protein
MFAPLRGLVYTRFQLLKMHLGMRRYLVPLYTRGGAGCTSCEGKTLLALFNHTAVGEIEDDGDV